MIEGAERIPERANELRETPAGFVFERIFRSISRKVDEVSRGVIFSHYGLKNVFVVGGRACSRESTTS